MERVATKNPPPREVREQDGRFTYPDREATAARVPVVFRDPAARTRRALLTLGACWGLAVVAVFLPLLHFVLVPGLLVLGPILALGRLREDRTLVHAAGACPACGAPQEFALGTPWRERTVLRCDACGRRLELEMPAAPH